MNINRVDNNMINFTRMPNNIEMVRYTNSVNKGLNILNKQMDIIIHNSSAPSLKSENTGIGSLFSRTVQEKLLPFLKQHGFTGIQQEPNCHRKSGDFSPYAPASSAKNILMIPLEKLTTEEYGEILSKETYAGIVSRTKTNDTVNYKNVSEEYDKALREAYKNFKKNKNSVSELKNFKSNNPKLERAAIYHVLDNYYKTNWEKWDGIDKNLYAPYGKEQAKEARKRISEIKKIYKDEIDFFFFKQFLLEQENVKSNKLTKQVGITIIGDSPVASPQADEWIYQDLYMEGVAIGCPPDYFSKNGQRWGFKYFNPKHIFKSDGSLGKAGKILKEKYDSFFKSFPGGLRIDHVIGLIDPFIYSVDSKKMEPSNSGRIYSLFTGIFRKKPEEYSNIMKKIVLDTAKENGLHKSDIICEDLGEVTEPTVKVMKELGLGGIGVTQFNYRGAQLSENSVIMIGSHDNVSLIEYTDDLFTNPKKVNDFAQRTEFLAKDIAPKGATDKEIADHTKKLRNDKKAFINANFAELFTSPARRIQIFFTDFWGIGKTYNTPGTSDGNWTLRIGSDFEKDYYKAVAEGKAPNLPNSIAIALRHRGLDKKYPQLMKDLNISAKILREKP